MDPDSYGRAYKCSGRENLTWLVTALIQLMSAESSSLGECKGKGEKERETNQTAKTLTSITDLANG